MKEVSLSVAPRLLASSGSLKVCEAKKSSCFSTLMHRNCERFATKLPLVVWFCCASIRVVVHHLVRVSAKARERSDSRQSVCESRERLLGGGGSCYSAVVFLVLSNRHRSTCSCPGCGTSGNSRTTCDLCARASGIMTATPVPVVEAPAPVVVYIQPAPTFQTATATMTVTAFTRTGTAFQTCCNSFRLAMVHPCCMERR